MTPIYFLSLFFSLAVCVPTNTNMENPVANTTMLTFITTVEGKSYFVDSSEGRDWEAATIFCTSFRMRLASFTSKAQFDALNQAYDSTAFHAHFWVSGRETHELSQFAWNVTGTEIPSNIPYDKNIDVVPFHTCLRYYSKPNNASHLYPLECIIRARGVICETF